MYVGQFRNHALPVERSPRASQAKRRVCASDIQYRGPLILFVRKYSVYRELTIKTGHIDAAVRDGWGGEPGELSYGIAWLHVAVPKLVFRSKASKAWSVAGEVWQLQCGGSGKGERMKSARYLRSGSGNLLPRLSSPRALVSGHSTQSSLTQTAFRLRLRLPGNPA